MKNSSRFILVILLLVISWWLQNLLDTKPELITREKTRFSNYYIEDFNLTAHNKDGAAKYSLQAKRLDHYEQESVAEIQQIRAEFYNKESNWTVTANKANLYKDKEKIVFYDDVKIFRPKQADRTGFSFHTDKITLFTDTEILQTDSHVTISSNGNTLESNGLIYDSQQGILELKADVKVTYVK